MWRKSDGLTISSNIPVLLLLVLFVGCSSNQTLPGSPSTGGPGGGSGSGTGNSGPTVGAYVYVSNSPLGDYQYQITAYAADANGQLTPLGGSPFKDNVAGITLNGAYVMGETQIQTSSTGVVSNNFVDAFKIGSDGALTPASQTDMHQFSKGCGIIGGAFFDRTGQTLYAIEGDANCSGNKGVASFSVDQSSGNLNYLGDVGTGRNGLRGVSFAGNDLFAYSALPGCMYPSFNAFSRGSNGLLNYNQSYMGPTPAPTPPPGLPRASFVNGYVPGQSAADSSNHIVFAEFPCFGQGGPTQPQLATYTIDADGNLTTTDTYATMPTAAILTSVFGTLAISPSDKFLAVADSGGLQIYHFNGANPVTTFTDLLTTDNISQIAWDKKDHLYAITGNVQTSPTNLTNANKLYVFNVTDTSVTQSPGSPYTIAFPFALAVQSK